MIFADPFCRLQWPGCGSGPAVAVARLWQWPGYGSGPVMAVARLWQWPGNGSGPAVAVAAEAECGFCPDLALPMKKEKRRKKIFIQMKCIWFYYVYILIVK